MGSSIQRTDCGLRRGGGGSGGLGDGMQGVGSAPRAVGVGRAWASLYCALETNKTVREAVFQPKNTASAPDSYNPQSFRVSRIQCGPRGSFLTGLVGAGHRWAALVPRVRLQLHGPGRVLLTRRPPSGKWERGTGREIEAEADPMTRPRQPYSNVSTMFRSLDVRSGSQSVSRRHRLPPGEGRPEPRGDPAAGDGLRVSPGMGCAGRREAGRTERVGAGRGWGPGAAITGAEPVQEQMWDIQTWRERKGRRGDSPPGVGPRAAGRPRSPSFRRAASAL